MESPVRCAIYGRVSLEEQVGQFGLQAQLSELRADAQKKGYACSSSWEFIDDGYSGADVERPALTRLRQLAADHAIDVILVHDPDRLARSLVHQLILDEEFEAAGVRLEYLTIPTDTSPEGKLLRQVKGMISEYERVKIRERTLRGRRQKAKMGFIVGGRRPYGYRYVGKADGERGRYEINTEEAEVVCRMFGWIGEGLSIREIVVRLKELGLSPQRGRAWGRSSVHRVLSNPVYAGTAYYGRRERTEPLHPRSIGPRHIKKTSLRARPPADWISIPVPAIVGPALFERVQAQLRRNVELCSGQSVRFYLLKGLLRCGLCGRKLVGLPSHGAQYYRCQGRDRLATPERCNAALLAAPGIEDFVWGAVAEVLRDPGLLREKVARHMGSLARPRLEAQPSRLEQSLAKVEHQLSRALDAYVDDSLNLPELKAKIADLKERKSALEAALQQARAEEAKYQGQESRERQIDEFCRLAMRGLQALDAKGRQKLLRSILDEVTITGTDVEIRGILPGRTPPDAAPSGPPVLVGNHPPQVDDRSNITQLPSRPGLNCLQRLDDRSAGIGQDDAGEAAGGRAAAAHVPGGARDDEVHSVAGALAKGAGLLRHRPFRAPHHTVSEAGLIGGGSGVPRPGEVSLAHNGVLFLDELPEFPRNVLELLRQPLEDRSVTIARSSMTLTFPSGFILISGMNPCPCSFHGGGGGAPLHAHQQGWPRSLGLRAVGPDHRCDSVTGSLSESVLDGPSACFKTTIGFGLASSVLAFCDLRSITKPTKAAATAQFTASFRSAQRLTQVHDAAPGAPEITFDPEAWNCDRRT